MKVNLASGASISIPIPSIFSRSWITGWSRPSLGVWWAVRRLSGSIVEIEVECSNAAIVPGQPGFTAGQMTEVVTTSPDRGWQLAQDCVRDWPSQWYPQRAAFRRYAMYPTNRPDLAAQALAVASGIVSPSWPIHRDVFGPANLPLPTLSPMQLSANRQLARTSLTLARNGLESGLPFHTNEDTEDGSVGPVFYAGWRPWGPTNRAAPAGSGVHFSSGWQQSVEWMNMALLAAECCHERAWHAYHVTTGEVITCDHYGDPSPDYSPGTGDPNNGWLPEFRDKAVGDPLPLPFDAAHSIRGFRHLIALSEMMDSPMVRRAIAGRAAQARLEYSEKGKWPVGGYTPTNLRNTLAWAMVNPEQGVFGYQLGRITGWPMWIMAQHLKVNGGSEGDKDWAEDMLLLANTAKMPTGITQRVSHPDPSPGTDVWYNATYDMAQSFEASIFWHGATALETQLGQPPPAGLFQAAASLFSAPLRPYYSGEYGPPHFIYVADRGGSPLRTITDGQGDPAAPGDATHMEALAALMISKEPAGRWVTDSTQVGARFNSWPEKESNLASRIDLNNTASLLAQYQRL
jgi:hypothetical protein